MRTRTILSLAVGAIALVMLTPVPKASAITLPAPAAVDTAAPSNGVVEQVRYVCRRYRVRRHGRWYWTRRCWWRPGPYYRPYYRPYRHRYYRHRYWYRW